jgi:endonuclease YncB( thermonuclease family)
LVGYFVEFSISNQTTSSCPWATRKKVSIGVKKKVSFFSLVLTFLLTLPCLAWAWSGEVVGITDGDTITVLHSKTLKDVKIRLYGIDCPEGGQAFSKKAKQFTSKMVYGKVVEVKVMATDRYGRTVAMIFVDKTLLNEELVKAGLAWVYDFYCSEPICESWKNFQIGARFDKRGLWADPDRIPPWEFRRKKRSQ